MTNEIDYEEGEVNDFSDDETVNSPKPPPIKEKNSKKHKKRKRDSNLVVNGTTEGLKHSQKQDHKKVKKKSSDIKNGNIQKCKYFMEGRCSKGNECTFSHDFKPPKRLELCRYYITGNCGKGDECIYYHKEFPCRYFHTGVCKHGDNCRFSHEPLTPVTKEMLDKSIQESSAENQNGRNFEDVSNENVPRVPVLPSPLPLRAPPQRIFGSLPPLRPPVQPIWNGPPRPFIPMNNAIPPNNSMVPMNPRPMMHPNMGQPFIRERLPPRMPIMMNGYSNDVDYRSGPRNPNQHQRFPPFQAHPHMIQNNIKPSHRPPVSAKNSNKNYLDDEIGKLATLITSKPPTNTPEEKKKETSPVPISDPRLSKSGQSDKCDAPVEKESTKSNVFGGLIKKEVIWKVQELDLEGFSVYHCPNLEASDPRSKNCVNILLAATAVKHRISLTDSETDTSTEKTEEPKLNSLENSVIVPKSNESRRPYRIQLNQMASTVINNQDNTSFKTISSQDRSYLSDGRFKRRKITPVKSDTEEKSILSEDAKS